MAVRRTRRRRFAVLLLAVLTVTAPSACDRTPAPDATATASAGPGTVTVGLDGRPFQLHVPRSYDRAAKAPLVVLLHGFGSSAAEQEGYFRLTGESERLGFLYAMPDGTTNRTGKRFWNATDACCDFDRSGVDDVGYLRRLIATVSSSYAVDPGRVALIGHSNGGYMAYRMACEHASAVTAVVSLAGAADADPARCAPARPVSVLQIHGTEDRTVLFGGRTGGGGVSYPSAATAVERWRGHDGCTGQGPAPGPALDLDSGLPGDETTVSAWTPCRDGTRVELWSVVGGGHIPALSAAFAPAVAGFLTAGGR